MNRIRQKHPLGMKKMEPVMADQNMMLRESVEVIDNHHEDRVTLDVGGRHFSTSRKTLLSHPNSNFNSMLKEGVRHFAIERDVGHFLYVLKYL